MPADELIGRYLMIRKGLPALNRQNITFVLTNAYSYLLVDYSVINGLFMGYVAKTDIT